MFRVRLKQLREKAGYSQYSFADKFGVAQSTVGGWEAGKREPNFDTMQRLADFFNVSVDYLLGGAAPTPRKKGIKIPVLGTIPAGIPIEAVEEILGDEEITEEMAACGDYFALQIKGDSMEPRIKNGDVVIVRKQSDVDSGRVAVVLLNGHDATVKKLVKHEDGISLVPFNGAYSPRFYTNKEVLEMPLVVLGLVVELRAKMI